MLTQCFIGLGSNLDRPIEQLKSALAALKSHTSLRNVVSSSFYRSKPMGPSDQPDYVNAVASLETELDAHSLLDILQGIEHEQGRVRQGERWGPRTLDLDLLAYGCSVISSERLIVPHPGIIQRSFVIIPWAEIAPDFRIPGLGAVRDMAQLCAADKLVLLENSPL